jgi:aspartyl/asparaginyl beta-hydroxylase (cupin superfamily)
MLVENHQPDCTPIVMELTKWVFAKLQASMAQKCLSEDDVNQLRQHQGMLIVVLHYIIMSTSTEFVSFSLLLLLSFFSDVIVFAYF